jgi:23S rRNA (cytidine2498-2'-O)-methyltransferase
VGVHAITEDPATRWAGGVPPLTPQAEVVSRAYYKLAEAILWSGLPIRANDHAAEIGCAPGGASQYLLERGLHVLGVDPAIVDRRVASHAGFRHLRARGGDLPRREFRHCKWLFVDANVAPDKSLTTIENLVTNPQVRIRGIIVQLKLSDYEHHRELPHWIARVQSWGYRQTACRQLAFNRRELTLAARWPREPRKPGEGAAAMTGSAGQSAAESASEN